MDWKDPQVGGRQERGDEEIDQAMIKNNGRGIRVEHTHWHQDREMKFKELPFPGKLNVLCDRECERRLGQVNEEREQVEKHGNMSGTRRCVEIQGKPITGRILEVMVRRKYWRKVARH